MKGSSKLAAALDCFSGCQIAEKNCADLGCNVGGFTAELLRRGAKRVHAVDTGYGALDWGLRQDERVDVRERQNALHQDDLKELDLIVCDLAWTPQSKIIPKVFAYLSPKGWLLSLIKPQYEAPATKSGQASILTLEQASEVAVNCFRSLQFPTGWQAKLLLSPIAGRKGSREFWGVFMPLGTEDDEKSFENELLVESR